MTRWPSSSFHRSSGRLPIPRLAARPRLVVHLLVVCSLLTSAARLRLRRAQSSRSPKSLRRFTGQVLDDAAGGLYFYNARYYDPALGRFIQADTIVPQPVNPQSLNRYSYAANNPLRYVDPSGHRECEDDNDCQIPKRPPRRRVFPDRDLTQFAVAQAQFMAQSPVTGWLAFENAHSAQNGSPMFKISAYLTFQGLVGDGKRWDLKDEMLSQLGSSFLLCSASICYWFEYSVLGNILCGYVGTQAGFSEGELRLGAGYAEARDPENSAKRNWPAIHPIAYLPAERRDFYYDDPYDYAAVSMGIELSRRHGSNVTLQAFQALVAEYHDLLALGAPSYGLVEGSGEPYRAGHFDNRPR
ncbi:RHS repeat-associated core domain-containing protein [Candidatus Amarolinea aalborgensis]|uniref:RHS repeat-associated core domain-containing protein n=1 Tax=Candidatus Amarolinea aalborgensis TaxID=2249329 RepID=UPI003BF95471